MIGLVPSPALSAAVEKEAAIHGDICRVQMEDTYRGLREKVATLYQFIFTFVDILSGDCSPGLVSPLHTAFSHNESGRRRSAGPPEAGPSDNP